MPVVSSVSTRQATTRQRASRGSKSSSGGGGSSTTGTGVDATVTQILPRPLADKAHQPGPPDEMCLLDTHQVSRLTIAKIKPCLASRNLSDGGKKATLVSRLQSWRASNPLVYDTADTGDLPAGMTASNVDLVTIIATGTKVNFTQAGQFLSGTIAEFLSKPEDDHHLYKISSATSANTYFIERTDITVPDDNADASSRGDGGDTGGGKKGSSDSFAPGDIVNFGGTEYKVLGKTAYKHKDKALYNISNAVGSMMVPESELQLWTKPGFDATGDLSSGFLSQMGM